MAGKIASLDGGDRVGNLITVICFVFSYRDAMISTSRVFIFRDAEHRGLEVVTVRPCGGISRSKSIWHQEK